MLSRAGSEMSCVTVFPDIQCFRSARSCPAYSSRNHVSSRPIGNGAAIWANAELEMETHTTIARNRLFIFTGVLRGVEVKWARGNATAGFVPQNATSLAPKDPKPASSISNINPHRNASLIKKSPDNATLTDESPSPAKRIVAAGSRTEFSGVLLVKSAINCNQWRADRTTAAPERLMQYREQRQTKVPAIDCDERPLHSVTRRCPCNRVNVGTGSGPAIQPPEDPYCGHRICATMSLIHHRS